MTHARFPPEQEETQVSEPQPTIEPRLAVPVHAPAEVDGGEPSIRFDAGPRGGRGRLEGLDGVQITVGDTLDYEVFPVAAAHDRWAATAVVVALECDDGSTLAGAGCIDQYGIAMTAEAQSAAHQLWVDQWNRRTAALDALVGKRITAAWLTLAATGEPVTAHLRAVTIRKAESRPSELLAWVDTRRGTRSSDRFSRGNTAPIVTVPHGGVFGLPMTDARSNRWPYRWQSDAPRLQAFATSHIPSPWIGDRGVFQLMPSSNAEPALDPRGRALGFDRADEHAGPDRYRVVLGDIEAELTAAAHAIGMRFTTNTPGLSLVTDHLASCTLARWHDDGIALRLDVTLRDSEEAPVHFMHVVLPSGGVPRLSLERERLRGWVRFESSHVEVVIGVSTIDSAQARANAGAAGSVERMFAASAKAWREVLGRVQIPDAQAVPADVIRSIAGSLARLHSYPNVYDEPGEQDAADHPTIRYRSPVDGNLRSGPLAANNGFWDTYRTAWPLLGVLAPHTAGALADGFVQHYLDYGWVARWSAPGPVDCMTGTTSDTVFAGLAAQGVPFRLRAAYESAVRHATVPAGDRGVGRAGLAEGIFRGYIDTATPEGLSWTLDNAINDAAVANLAGLLIRDGAADGERLEAEQAYFARRALAYRDVFHRELGFFIGRERSGNWRTDARRFDPADWGNDYTETNAWGTAFTAPHDGAGLAELHGGESELGRALDTAFATSETADIAHSGSYGFVIHEMSEAREARMGMVALSNQPAHHIPLMYCFAGRHDDAHRVVTEARDRLFVGSDAGQGYPGDEDNGEMSAWYLWSVLGLYPLVPGTGEFVLTPPLLPKIVIRSEGAAHPLEITAVGAGKRYIKAVRIDGAGWNRIAVPADVLRSARSIAFELSEVPCAWASDTRPSSFSRVHGVDAPLRDLLAVRPGSITDDTGSTTTRVGAGESVEVEFTAPTVVGLYTLTIGGGPAPLPLQSNVQTLRWRLHGRTVGGEIVPIDEREEFFDAPRQTRPFRPRTPASEPLTALRLELLDAADIVQLEAFAP